MFDWLKILGRTTDTRPAAGALLLMMRQGEAMFEVVRKALLGELPDPGTRERLFATDRAIDETEQRLRRELLVHLSMQRANDAPACLALMSVAKDAERIGDYCKNLYDLAAQKPMRSGTAVHREFDGMSATVLDMLRHATNLHELQDVAGARDFLKRARSLEDVCDRHVVELIDGRHADLASGDAIVAALAFRYLKRITAHAMNIVTSIVMPVDKLDFYDER